MTSAAASWNGCRRASTSFARKTEQRVCDRFDIGLNHHHADSDSRACAEILLRYIRDGADYIPFSLAISILRMIVIVLPVAWLLSRQPSAERLVWLAFPISEFVALIASILFAAHLYRIRTRAMPIN